MMTISTRGMCVSGMTLITEASDLGPNFRQIPLELVLESHRTGTKLVMIKGETKRDAEGEVISWEYAPLVRNLPRPELVNLRLAILND